MIDNEKDMDTGTKVFGTSSDSATAGDDSSLDPFGFFADFDPEGDTVGERRRPAEKSEARKTAGAPVDRRLSGKINAASTVFGGKLFDDTRDGRSFICHAILTSRDAASVEYSLTELFDRTADWDHNHLIHYEGAAICDNYTVFSFKKPRFDTMVPLSSLSSEEMKHYAKYIFRMLLLILHDYKSTFAKNEKYIPLACLCLDTVYLDTKSGTVRVLPLKSAVGDYPRTFPRDAGEPDSSDATDLYSAAYIYVILSNGGTEKDIPDFRGLGDEFIDRCLSPFPVLRPRLSEALERFGVTDAHGRALSIPLPDPSGDTGGKKPKEEKKHTKKDGFSFFEFSDADGIGGFFKALGHMFACGFRKIKTFFTSFGEREESGDSTSTFLGEDNK